jgi:predicted SnoaL-like aldol condensation-catalyzing enzyme
MQILSIMASAAAALTTLPPGVSASPFRQPQSFCAPNENILANHHGIREIFNGYVEEWVTQRNWSAAAAKYLSPNMIQHNPQIANGSAAMVAAVRPILSNYDGPDFSLVIVDEEKKLAVTYNRYIGKKGTGLPLTAVADVYRFEGTCIVEHWDDLEALPVNSTNPNPF